MGEQEIIGGRYTLGTKVGSGPLSTVWKGRASGGTGYTRTVAIRHLAAEHAKDPFAATFGKQASALMGRVHPHVEGVLDIVEHGGAHYVVTEWIDGPSLRHWIEAHHERGGPAPWGQLLAIAADVLFGLHALHTRSVPLVHGGVSTSAIRLDRVGFPMLTRFGARSALDAVKADPEWARRQGLRTDPPEGKMTPAADVFGMGLLLYTVLAGASDVGVVPEELKERLLAGKPVDLGMLREDVPAVVLRTVERALAPNPTERFESAASMARSCQLILRSLAEMSDPPALAASIESVIPRDKAQPPGAPPSLPSTPSTPPRASSSKPAGLSPASTDQLDIAELRKMRIKDGADGDQG